MEAVDEIGWQGEAVVAIDVIVELMPVVFEYDRCDRAFFGQLAQDFVHQAAVGLDSPAVLRLFDVTVHQ